jgi:hypothetical protein
MSPLCPNGHSSETTDYCDQCGAPIASGHELDAERDHASVGEDEDASTSTSPASFQTPCPTCGATRSGDDRYCEGCGYDFLAPPSNGPAWEAVASADREQFERFKAAGVSFPSEYPSKRFKLDGPAMRIGRGRSGEAAPEIDLAGTLEDPGISRLHAVLERQEDGTYAVRDLGSTNGTTINDDPSPVGTDTAVPISEGDRIRLGAWTTIRVEAR